MNFVFLIFLFFLSLPSFCQEDCLDIITDGPPFICSGDSPIMQADFKDSTGGSITGNISWSIEGDVVSTSNDFGYNMINNSSQQNIITVFASGIGNNECTDVDTILVTVNPKPFIDFEIMNFSCPTSNDAKVEFVTNSNQSVLDQNNMVLNSPIENLIQGEVMFRVEETIGSLMCAVDTTITIFKPDQFSVQSYQIINDNCGQGTGKITFDSLVGGTLPYTFYNQYLPVGTTAIQDSLLEDIISIDTTNYSLINLPQGAYTILLRDGNGCEHTLEDAGSNPLVINIETPSPVVSPPSPPIYEEIYEVCSDNGLNLVNNNQEHLGFKHYYSFSDGSEVIVGSGLEINFNEDQSVNNQISVYVEGDTNSLASNAGCLSDSVTINLIQVSCGVENSDTPTNTFNPNSPISENQTFKIDLEPYGLLNEQVAVIIYNRWGDIIKDFSNYDNEVQVWDGTNMNGDQMPIGTYFYVLQIPEKNVSTSNWVYLER